MPGLQNINILFNQNGLIVILSLLAVFLISFFLYRNTIPKISIWQKYILITLRSLALSFILLLIFEPELQIKSEKLTKPKNFVFIDNSKSVNYSDTSEIKNLIQKINKLENSESIDIKLYTFSSEVSELKSSSIKFNGATTNLEKVFDFINNKDKNISSITIVSDGIINDGKLQKQKFNALNFPVNTVSIGNDQLEPDIKISKIDNSDFIYLNKKTQIKLILESTKINEEVILKLSDKKKNYSSKRVFIDQKFKGVTLDFIGNELGKKTLTLSLSKIPGEKNLDNNNRSFDIEIVKEQKKVALISSSLSFDYRFIKNILKNNKSIDLAEFIQFNSESFLNKKTLKESDALFFIGFPSDNTSAEEIDLVKKIISSEKIPLFLFLSPGTNLKKLNDFKAYTGIIYNQNRIPQDKEFTVKQIDFNSPILKINGSSFPQLYSALPPLSKNFKIVYETQPSILATANYDNNETNEPVIITNKINSIKSVSVLASGIWKWKLNNKDEDYILDNFINSASKWLTTETKIKNISLTTNKTEYLNGESIAFSAKVYSEILEPILDSEIILNIYGEEYSREIKLRNNMDGSYSSELIIPKKGQYSYKAKVLRKAETLSDFSGNFKILSKDLESADRVANHKLLNEISTLTGGQNFYINQSDSLTDSIVRISKLNEFNESVISTYKINHNKFILFFIIFLFTLEWTLRKRFQMI